MPCSLLQLLLATAKVSGLVILALSIYGLLRAGWFLFLAGGSRETILLARKTFLYALGGIALAVILYSTGSIVSWSDAGADLIARCGIEA
ncbi:MAG: hypothetical protein HY473_01535 [Candidatus Sungbacteria bacterium]|uniref:Uncharacterized protein n=1 Tax=Candidatus Sungiibacteriota bacterium TaxID=2750080 RepID=A0A933DTK4_9BACT|nr:hypothetical protein [Candidatus Sungbacteria bacterium]